MAHVVAYIRNFELGARMAQMASSHGKSLTFPEKMEVSHKDFTSDTLLGVVEFSEESFESENNTSQVSLIKNLRSAYPHLLVVGIFSRVRKKNHDEAKKAGCSWVFSRSVFLKNFLNLLSA